MANRSSGFLAGAAFAGGLVIGLVLPRPWQSQSLQQTQTAPAPQQSAAQPSERPPIANAPPPGGEAFESFVAAGNKALDEKRYRDAVAAYDPALALRFDPNVATDRGVALRETGEHDVALAAFEFVLLRVPTHWQARYNRAVVLMQMGRLDDARMEADRLMADHGDNPAVTALQSAIQKNRRQ
jgi:tetratricopeptide (TPR) repeat protein